VGWRPLSFLGAMELEGMVRPVVEAAGLELVDVTFRREAGRRILRVTVDREEGVDLDTIARTSERLSRRLDLEDFAPGPYTLEVSSPGVERPLRRPEEFARRVGEKVKVRTTEPIDGARNHAGVVVAADGEGVTIATEQGERTLFYTDISSARTVFEWRNGGGKR
jgi:ribosome maturation factor RimP